MASTKTRRDVLTEFRSSGILKAARKVFSRKGFSGATVDEIAETAGLAKGTIYLYFPSKRDVYLAALKDGMAQLLETTRANMEAAPDARSKVRAFIATRLRHADEDRDFFKILLSEFGNLVHPAAINREFRNLYLQQLKALEAAVGQAVQAGEMRAVSTEAAATAIYEMTRGQAMKRILGWTKSTADDDAGVLCDIIWTGIGV